MVHLFPSTWVLIVMHPSTRHYDTVYFVNKMLINSYPTIRHSFKDVSFNNLTVIIKLYQIQM